MFLKVSTLKVPYFVPFFIYILQSNHLSYNQIDKGKLVSKQSLVGSQRNFQSISDDDGLETLTLISCNNEGVYNWSFSFSLCPSSVVPCAPQNVSAVKECGADAITVTWINKGSAIFYVAMAKDSHGIIHSCNSMDLTCKIEGLKCSTNYTAYVIASNFLCNSSQSEMVAIETGTARDFVFIHLGCLTVRQKK